MGRFFPTRISSPGGPDDRNGVMVAVNFPQNAPSVGVRGLVLEVSPLARRPPAVSLSLSLSGGAKSTGKPITTSTRARG